jgi:hypothetical protein
LTSLITGSALSPAGAVYTLAGPNLAFLAAPGVPSPRVLELPSGGTRGGVEVFWPSDPMLGPPPAFWGFALGFVNPGCVDARVFTGVRFTVSGDLGTCALRVGAVPSEDNSPANTPFGSCAVGPCISPLSRSIGIGTTVVRFSEMTFGSPRTTPDPAALNAVEWVLSLPAGSDVVGCQADITVSDVAFVADAMPPICPPPPAPCDEGASCVVPNATAPGGCVLRYTCVAGVETPVPCPL